VIRRSRRNAGGTCGSDASRSQGERRSGGAGGAAAGQALDREPDRAVGVGEVGRNTRQVPDLVGPDRDRRAVRQPVIGQAERHALVESDHLFDVVEEADELLGRRLDGVQDPILGCRVAPQETRMAAQGKPGTLRVQA